MERITSERIRHAEQHAQTLLRSLEQLKEGSIGSFFNSDQPPGFMRESLPRKAKDYKKDRRGSDRNNGNLHEKPYCSCGNVAAGKCNAHKCVKCCMDPSCGSKKHIKRRMKNSEKRKKTNYYESDESSHTSDEDLPLANVVKRRKRYPSHTNEGSSPSTDEEWTPYQREEKKRRGRRGAIRELGSMQPSLHSVHSSVLPSSIRIPSVTYSSHGVPASSRCVSSPINPPMLSSAKEHKSLPQQWMHSERRMPALTAMLPNSTKIKGTSHPPITTTIRLPLVPSTGQQKHQSHILPTGHNSMSSVIPTKKSSYPSSKYNSHQNEGNCEKRPIDSRKENKGDNDILMFYVRYPYNTVYCDQGRLIDLFRPYCSLRHIQWIDKRSAYVTISEDATFQTYDSIYLNLMMKADYENNNLLYVSPYRDYIKKKESLLNAKEER